MDEHNFRARRVKLSAESFLIAPEVEPEPSDPIDEETWTGIVFLPDDVSIRTSEYHGTALRDAHELWGHWISIVLDIQSITSNPRNDALQVAAMSAIDEWQASIYFALTGFYRQAIACLRPAFESLLAGAYFRAFPDAAKELKWIEGHADFRLQPSVMRRKLHEVEPYSKFGNLLSKDGWGDRIYDALCSYQHGRVGYTTTSGETAPTANVTMWMSNGPVYEERAFALWSRLYFNTHLLCLLLVGLAEPRVLTSDKPTDLTFMAYLRRAWDTHPEPGVRGAAVPIAEYLDAEAHR